MNGKTDNNARKSAVKEYSKIVERQINNIHQFQFEIEDKKKSIMEEKGIINFKDLPDKEKNKIYWRHSGFPGGIYQRTFEEMMEKDSREVIMHAVKGMVPKNKLANKSLTRLRIFKDEKHDFEDKIKKETK
jgi:hypothetical protein